MDNNKSARGGNSGKHTVGEIVVDGRHFTDEGHICDLFNNLFLDFPCLNPDFDRVVLQANTEHNLVLYPTTPEEVRKIITRSTRRPAPGLDEVSGHVLRAVADEVCVPLSYLVNESFVSGCFPGQLKRSKAVPIFKNKGSRSNPSNYRNVCIQSQFAKVFESCFSVRVVRFLESHGLLGNFQNGFRRRKSTNTAIDELCDLIYNSLNSKECPLALYFDLSRAFDVVNHDLLLRKLYRLGIRGVAQEWIASYLSDREQAVVMGSSRSAFRPVRSGVPQGSILGPLLFIVFINDMPLSCVSPSSTVVYADDTNFFISRNDPASAVSAANASVREFVDWCAFNGLTLNSSKSFFMRFLPKNATDDQSLLIRANQQSIAQVENIKFLGIHLDQKMTWEKHVEDLTNKISKSCFVLRYLRNTVSSEVLKLAYFGLVQSNLSYGLIFWGNSSHTRRVFVIQKKIVRTMAGLAPLAHCRESFIGMGILTLPSLYIYMLILYIKDRESLLARNSDFHDHDTRSGHELRLPFSRLGVGQNSPVYQGAVYYNKYVQLFGKGGSSTSLLEFLVSQCFYSTDEFLNFKF